MKVAFFTANLYPLKAYLSLLKHFEYHVLPRHKTEKATLVSNRSASSGDPIFSVRGTRWITDNPLLITHLLSRKCFQVLDIDSSETVYLSRFAGVPSPNHNLQRFKRKFMLFLIFSIRFRLGRGTPPLTISSDNSVSSNTKVSTRLMGLSSIRAEGQKFLAILTPWQRNIKSYLLIQCRLILA